MSRLQAYAATAILFAAAASAQMQQNVAKGFSVDKSYHIEDFDSISTFNGNLAVILPIGPRWTVSSALSYQLSLTYGGNVWQFKTIDDEYFDETADPPRFEPIWVESAYPGWKDSDGVQRNVNAGLGWNLTLGYLETGGEPGMPYISPDGARHHFYNNLTEDDSPVAGFTYTRDGTYLRRSMSAGSWKIEFPDGTYHLFESATGRLASMHDRFGNAVTIQYQPGPNCATDTSDCAEDWTISDGFRTHKVDMKRLTPGAVTAGAETYSFEVVKTVTFSSGTAAAATWTFDYAEDDTLVGVSRALAKNQDCRIKPVILAPILESVTLPEQSGAYEITMDRGDAAFVDSKWTGKFSSVKGEGGGMPLQECASTEVVEVSPTPSVSGHLRKIRRPTGAITEWTYQMYGFPALVSANTVCRNKTVETCKLGISGRSAFGVKDRIVWARDGTTQLSKRSYLQEGSVTVPIRTTSVTTYDGTTPVATSVHYYSTHFSQFDAKAADYGLPFTDGTTGFPDTETATVDTGGRRLSTKLLDGAENLLRYSYVQYAADPAPTPDSDRSSVNRRLVSERTVHLDAEGNVRNEVITSHGDFDGLGHFRESTTASMSRSSGPAVTRTVKTAYNTAPDPAVGTTGAHNSGEYGESAGTFVQMPTGSPWILNTYSSQTVSAGTKSNRTLFEFVPATGFLKRRRVLKDTALSPAVGANDVVTEFTHTGGNVTSEKSYGGDIGADGLATSVDTDPLKDLTLLNPVYTVDHTWSYGILSTSQYASAPFKSVDRVISSATGLPGSSTDPSGLLSKYEYDVLGRLIWSIAPDGEHPTTPEELYTEYVYSTPATANATVTINQRNGSKTSSILRTAKVEYDALGRVTAERQRMPNGSWSLRRTLYDGLSRVKSVSEWAHENLVETSRPKTIFTYDPLGRVLTSTAPDGSVFSTAYTGLWKAERTVKISTAAGSETEATTTERTDDFGRLYKVIEPGGTETSYSYDPGGRLATVNMTDGSVTQTRSFVYDGRGFLMSEDHPESALTSYQYDARGHARKRTIGSSVVTFDFDVAERLVKVMSGSQTIKEFGFDRANSGTAANKDWSNGKLDYAVRHNHDAPGGDLTVKETYIYRHPAGRLSKKETTLSTGEEFEETYTYDRLGAPVTITYPSCISGCASISAPARTVTNVWSRGLLSAVSGYGNVAYADNGMVASVTHINADGNAGTVDAYAPDPGGMARPESITFSGFCNDLEVQPLTSKSVTSGSPAGLVAEASTGVTYKWYEVASDGTITALSTQTTSTLTVPITSPRSFFVRVSNDTCTVDSTTATVTPTAGCTPPTSTITVSVSILERNGSTATASVPAAASYQWWITGGDFVSSDSVREVEFFAYCNAAEVELTVKVGGCNTHSDGNKTIPTTAATTATLSVDNSSPIIQGGSKVIHVALTGAAPWTLTWSPSAPSCAATSSSFDCTATPASTTAYTLSAQDANGCVATSAPLTVTVAPPAPQNLVATATSTTQVAVLWTFGGASADSYEIQRRRAGSGWEADGIVTGATSATRTATAGAAYLYRVRAVKSNIPSAWSNADLATTVIFVDDPLVAGQDLVSAQHITQLRTAVNAVRALATPALPAATFTDASLSNVVAKAVHLQEIRTVLDAARSALVLPAVSYTPDLAAAKPIRAIFITELRGGVK